MDPISHYLPIELLGRGAMGDVWLAEDTQLPRKVAIKLLPRHLSRDEEAVARLLREAEAAARVEHPAVITIYESGMHEGQPYLVMQWADGETLERRLARGPLPIGEVVLLATQVADALSEVHALGIVHRDLKPSNIMLTAHGPKILDFGIASVRGAARLTATGAMVGTPAAMSPEQIRGLEPDSRTDLWGLGVVLFEALTGRAPFPGEHLEQVAYQILQVDPPPAARLRPETPAFLAGVVRRLLEKHPADRYQRAEDVLADLAAARAPAGTTAESPPRLAVLYFDVSSTNPEDELLAAGLTEDLIVDLVRLRGLRVASRGEVQPYRERPVPPRTLAREIGAEYVLSGLVQGAGTRTRISAQLVRAIDGTVLWGERFDRSLGDLFATQAEISSRITEALEVAIAPNEREMLGRAPSRDPEAYKLYLRARQLIDQQTRDSAVRAEDLLRRAIELDGTFALAHAALGESYAQRWMMHTAGPEVAAPALECARRALELEPDLLEGHLVRAMIQRLERKPEELLESLERVIALDPDHPQALEWAARCYLVMGRPARAIEILEPFAARRPERHVPHHYLSTAFEMLGRGDDAERAFRAGLEREIDFLRRHPDDPYARSLLAISLVRAGETEAGIVQGRRAVEVAPADGRVHYNAACALARAGRLDEAMTELDDALARSPQYVSDWPARDPDLAALRGYPPFRSRFAGMIAVDE